MKLGCFQKSLVQLKIIANTELAPVDYGTRTG